MAGDTPIVLHEKRRAPIVNVAGGVAGEQAAVRRGTRKEILDGRRRNGAIGRGKGIASQKLETPARSAIGAAAETIAMLFDSEFDDMPSNGARDVIHKLIPRIGPLHFGPIESANSGYRKSEKSQDIQTWQPSVERIRYPGVESIGRRRHRVIIGKCRLVQPVVAESRLIDPARRWRPHPIQAGYLSAGMNLRKPFRLQLRGVLYRAVVVPKEI